MKSILKFVPVLVVLCITTILLLPMKLEGVSVIFKVLMFCLAGILFLQAYTGPKIPGVLYAFLNRFLNISMAIGLIGILFRFLYWNGWHLELAVGTIFTSIGTAILLIK